MVAKCANPRCSAKFRFLKQGKLFLSEQIPPTHAAPTSRAPRGKGGVQHFWLCADCCRSFTLVRDEHEIRIVPLHPREHPCQVHQRAS